MQKSTSTVHMMIGCTTLNPCVWHSHEKGIIQVNYVSHIVVSK